MSTSYKIVSGAVAAIAILIGAFFLSRNQIAPEAIPGMRQYSSDGYGISFAYPDSYTLTEMDAPGDTMRRHHVVTLIRTADLPAPENGEGPTAITIEAYQNDLDKQTTEQWVRNSSASNFKLATTGLSPLAVDGIPALSYRWSGLYEGTTVAFANPAWVYVVSVTYLEPGAPIVQDFVAIRDSMRIAGVPVSPLPGGLTLMPGQSVAYQGLTLTLNSVSGDSRCPADVACIWAGAVTANVALSARGQTTSRAISSDATPFSFAGYEISIVSVDPAPRSNQPIPQNAYRVQFRVASLEGKG